LGEAHFRTNKTKQNKKLQQFLIFFLCFSKGVKRSKRKIKIKANKEAWQRKQLLYQLEILMTLIILLR